MSSPLYEIALGPAEPSYREPQAGRDARFRELESMISAGWGNVRGKLIERVRSQNGGTLPRVPDAWRDQDQGRERRPADAPRRTQRPTGAHGHGVLTREQIAALPEMVEGRGVSQVARDLGVDRGTVQWWLRKVQRERRMAVDLRPRRKT